MKNTSRNPALSPISKRKQQIQAKNEQNKYVQDRKKEEEMLLQDKNKRRMLWRKRMENNPFQVDQLALWAEEQQIIKQRERQKQLFRRKAQAVQLREKQQEAVLPQ